MPDHHIFLRSESLGPKQASYYGLWDFNFFSLCTSLHLQQSPVTNTLLMTALGIYYPLVVFALSEE